MQTICGAVSVLSSFVKVSDCWNLILFFDFIVVLDIHFSWCPSSSAPLVENSLQVQVPMERLLYGSYQQESK